MKRLIFFIITLTLSSTLSGQEEVKKKPGVVYKYKQYESFDLGSLEIKGNIIAPGDLSVRERTRRKFSRDLLERYHFDPEVMSDVRDLR